MMPECGNCGHAYSDHNELTHDCNRRDCPCMEYVAKGSQNGAQRLPEAYGDVHSQRISAKLNELNERADAFGFPYHFGVVIDQNGRLTDVDLFSIPAKPMTEEPKVRPGAKKCANCGELIQFASITLNSNIWTGWVHLNGGIDCDHYTHGRINAAGRSFYIAARPED